MREHNRQVLRKALKEFQLDGDKAIWWEYIVSVQASFH